MKVKFSCMVSCFAWKLKQCHPPQGIAGLDVKGDTGESSLSGGL